MSQSNQPVGSTQEDTNATGRIKGAYQRLFDEIAAVPAHALTPINIDVPTTVTTALGVLPELKPLAEELKKLHSFNVSALEKLEDYALALAHAHAVYTFSSATPESIKALADEAMQVRDQLIRDVQAAAGHGLIPAGRVGGIARSLGHRGVAVDIIGLVELVREFWSDMENKTAVTLARLSEYEILSDRLLTIIGERDQADAPVGQSTLRRQQAFTLLVKAYDEVRRGVAFLRWSQGDVDTIVPSLYAGRTVKAKKQEGPTSPEGTPGAPAPGAPPVGIPPAASASGAQEAPVPVGHPGSNPFTV